MTNFKKTSILLVGVLSVIALTACGSSNQNNTKESSKEQMSSSTSKMSSSSGSSTSDSMSSGNTSNSNEEMKASELDGTYTAVHEDEKLTLTLSENKGTLTKEENDGEKEIEKVEIDPTNQTIVIGDDVERYRIDGNQLTIEDISQESDENDTIVFMKQ